MQMMDNKDLLLEVDIDSVQVNPLQPRKIFILDDIEELAASIQEIGLIHPPVVRKLRENQFELIAGERRLRALKHLKKNRITILLRQSEEVDSAKSALIENIQRIDLNAIEIAMAMQELIQRYQLTQEQLADRIGKKRSTVANYLRVLQLPELIQEMILNGQLSLGHAKAILSLPKHLQLGMAKSIVEDQLTVRQAEKRAARIEQVKKTKKHKQDVFIFEIKNQLEQHFGTKVTMQSQGPQGKITFDYYSLDDLDRLLESFGVRIH